MYKISIVIPIFQNEKTIFRLCSDLIKNFNEKNLPAYYLHFLLVDDGSTDDSWNEMLRASQITKDVKFTLIRLTRNFGQAYALFAGYRHADGDCTITISADLQDPPELAPELFQNWLNGYKLVIGKRSKRDDGFVNDLISTLAWAILKKFALRQIPTGGFDYFLMDSELRNDIINSHEHNIFIQGRILFYGHKVLYVDYARSKRILGVSQTTFLKKIKFFMDALLSCTFLPIRIVSIFGLIVFLVSLIAIATIVWTVLVHGSVVKGWASTMTAILFFSGIQMLSIGILGEYIWRNLEEARKRPHFKIGDLLKINNKLDE